MKQHIRILAALAALSCAGVCCAYRLHGQQNAAGISSVPNGGLADSAWPKFHGDARNTGRSRYHAASPVSAWTFPILSSGLAYSSPAMGEDGTVFFGGEALHAVDGATGRQKWERSASGGFDASPVIGPGGLVYIGGGEHTFFALDGKTGKVRWQKEMLAKVHATAAVDKDGTVYVLCNNGTLAAFAGATGTQKWRFDTGGTTADWCGSSPVVDADGTVYFGTYQRKFFALNGRTGKVRWKIDLEARAFDGSPALAPNGSVIVTEGEKGIGRVVALDAKDGHALWTFKLSDFVNGSAAVGEDGTVYFGSGDHNVYALNGDMGKMLWQFTTGHWIQSTPALGPDGTVYIGSDDKNLYALDGKTGEKKWAFATQDMILSSPLLCSDGTLYFGSYDGNYYALPKSKQGAPPPVEPPADAPAER